MLVLITLEFGDILFGLGSNHQQLSVLILDGLTHLLHIGVAGLDAALIHIAHVEHGLGGEQEQVMRNLFLILGLKRYSAGRFALKQDVTVCIEHIAYYLGLLIAYGSLLGHLLQTLVNGLKVLYLELCIDDFLIADRIDCSVHMCHVLIVKAAQHMYNCVALADVAQELVAQTFALAGAFYQSCYIDNLNGGGNDSARMNQLCQLGQTFIRNGYGSYVGFYCTERKVRCLRLSA